MNQNPIGRSTELRDGQRMRRLIRHVRRGTPKRVAAEVAGIPVRTFDRWLTAAATADRKFEEGLDLTEHEVMLRAFRALLVRAEAGWEAEMVHQVIVIAIRQRSAKALMEMLRRHPATTATWNVPDKLDLRPQEEIEPPRDEEEMVAQIQRLHRIAQDRVERQKAGGEDAARDP